MKNQIVLAIAGLFVCCAVSAAPAKNFKTPDAAADAFAKVIETRDTEGLKVLLGDGWHDVIPTAGVEESHLDAFVKGYKAKHEIKVDGKRANLVVGERAWELPIPIAKDSHGWHFDTVAGAEEIRIRDIGRNEESAIKSTQAYFDAQLEYATSLHDGSPVVEYAQRFFSAPGKHDGLYWESAAGAPQSPLGPHFAEAPKEDADSLHGYHFRILTAQGQHAPGGAKNYVIDGHMTRGFAMIAWPADYADTGVMTFVISHDGKVYQRDFGDDTDKTVAAISAYDPDSSWQIVDTSHIDED